MKFSVVLKGLSQMINFKQLLIITCKQKHVCTTGYMYMCNLQTANAHHCTCYTCTCIISTHVLYKLQMHMYTSLYMLHMYMKFHVPSMLAIGVDKHTQQTNKQPQWLH